MNDVPVQGIPSREKYWSEANAEERLTMLRDELLFALQRVEWLASKLSPLARHTHMGDGRIVFEQTDEPPALRYVGHGRLEK